MLAPGGVATNTAPHATLQMKSNSRSSPRLRSELHEESYMVPELMEQVLVSKILKIQKRKQLLEKPKRKTKLRFYEK